MPGSAQLPLRHPPSRQRRGAARDRLPPHPPGRSPAQETHIFYYDFLHRSRRVVAMEWHSGELFPRVGFIVTNLTARPEGVVHFYNQRGTAELKEGKYALNWTRLSCHRFVCNQVRLLLFVLAYNLGNFLRRLALPRGLKHWSLRSLQVKLIKMGGRIVRHARQIGRSSGVRSPSSDRINRFAGLTFAESSRQLTG